LINNARFPGFNSLQNRDVVESELDDYVSDDVPNDAKQMALLLTTMGIKQWEPRVINQLLEFMHRYVSEILNDSNKYSKHSGRDKITIDDIRLAIETRIDKTSELPKRRTTLKTMSQSRNIKPFPNLPNEPGVALPEICLIKRNYQVLKRRRST